MKLTYSLTVIDDNGNMVVDHPLTADEAMIILAPHIGKATEPVAPIEVPADTPAPTPETPRRGRKPGARKAAKAAPGGWAPKPCCGSKGARHKKGCPSAGAAPSTVPARKSAPLPAAPLREDEEVDDEESTPLTEDQFDSLKHLQNIGDLSSKSFAKQHGIALFEVNRAITSRTFGEYRQW